MDSFKGTRVDLKPQNIPEDIDVVEKHDADEYHQSLIRNPKFARSISKILAVDVSREEKISQYGSIAESHTQHAVSKDRAEQATVENVLDPNTRMILFRLINSDLISEVDGCISTGKEANVYHATRYNDDQAERCAIKIYKTSILHFKDRAKYISGEHRFRKHQKHNSRAMVKLWAEKEFRNLKRLQQAKIPCPEAIHLNNNVLVMSFLGDSKGYPAPRLKNVEIDNDAEEKWWEIYLTTLKYMRMMYRECELVHGDLSEYNMLYLENQLYIIDVSQSVEDDHPHALEFLRQDIKNVKDFFRRKNVGVFSELEVFEFITNLQTPTDANTMTEQLNNLASLRDSRTEEEETQMDIEDKVFRQAYIPTNLDEVYDAERDINLLKKGEARELIYKALLADKVVLDSGTESHSEDTSDISGEDEDEVIHSDLSEDGRAKFRSGNVKPITKRSERLQNPELRKQRKQEAKEKRQAQLVKKMPKKEKKAKVSATAKPKKK
jgi:RIO kinase 1